MKRRNAGEGKLRRPVKRTKISDNFLGSTLVYVKLLLLWILVLAADYLLEFRFEYLWPFWLLVRSIYDSFKYQGLAFSVFFICIALTSDMICFLFIPVHWLFFAASTYVWVQYVWHTEKGICLPTVFLWLLFVYIEAAIRLREYKLHIDLKNLPFHLDLCRPFAAHCIGYPVVTLGFGFKSYVGYRMRQRRQKEIQKENETYYEVLRGALPLGSARDEAFNPQPSHKPGMEDRISNGGGALAVTSGQADLPDKPSRSPDKQLPFPRPDSSPDIAKSNSQACSKLPSGGGLTNGDIDYYMERRNTNSTGSAAASTNGDSNPPDDFDEGGSGKNLNRSMSKANGSGGNHSGGNHSGGNHSGGTPRDTSRKGRCDTVVRPAESLPLVIKLESDVKRLKCDLQLSRNRENELREQIVCYMSSERSLKSEISSLLVEKCSLEARINSLISTRAGEKVTMTALEKKLAEEKKQRGDFQVKLETERKTKKEMGAERAAALTQHSANTATVSKLESELGKLREELARVEERSRQADQEVKELRKNAGTHGDPEKLAAALNVAQDAKAQLEHTLSSETKVKMDLFSALGEAKRQLQIRETFLMAKDREILDLKAKIAEVLAVMPGLASGMSGASMAPGGFPNTSRNSATSGMFLPNNHNHMDLPATDLGTLDLPAATELSKLAGLGLADLEDKLASLEAANAVAATSSMYTPTTYSNINTNGSLNEA